MPHPSKALGLLSTVGIHLVAGQLHAEPRPYDAPATVPRPPTAQRTMGIVPSGVDTYTAFIQDSSIGAAGVGLVDARPRDGATGGTEASGGLRLWGGFLDRLVVQAEAGNDSEGRFVPSLGVAARVLGERKKGWAVGALGRYRTEGFSTIEGEIEGGLLGSFTQSKLHLDAGIIAGVGIEEEEADGEALLRFGYDVAPVFRLGFEGRVRRELAEETEMAKPAGEGEEWDAFVGAQATLALGQFFSCVTAGPQKPRFTEKIGWMAQFTVGGIAF
jgi:hypothetical protein